MQIPIVCDARKIVGWTSQVPEATGSALRHAEAERLLGGPISCVYVEIDNPHDALRAGAPPEWSGPWRCLAICRDDGRPAPDAARSPVWRHHLPRGVA
jgi:hypothetical protein